MCFVFETAQPLGPSSFSFDLPFLLKSQDNLANSGDIHSSFNFLYFGILLRLIFFQQMPSYFKCMTSLHNLTSIFSLTSHYHFICSIHTFYVFPRLCSTVYMAAETFAACLLGQEGSYLVPTMPFIVGKGNAGKRKAS